MHDQIVLATHIDDEKWVDLREKITQNEFVFGGRKPAFRQAVYLVDDFTGSGTSFVRRKKDGSWTGKVEKFWNALVKARERVQDAFPLAPDFSLHIHHYISSAQARAAIDQRLSEIRAERAATGQWLSRIEVTQGVLLPETTKITPHADPAVWEICDTYYDHQLFDDFREHLDESGQTQIRHGYGDAALPVVMEHNCPNNALTLLWAETEGEQGVKDRHPMRPLFPRRHRHS